MENEKKPGEKTPLRASGRSLTRREWVQRMLAGGGAGIAAPTIAAAKPAHAPSSMAEPANKTTGGDWKPEFFDEYQNQLLIALAEKIVPGSTGVQVNRFLDTALNAETQEVQRSFVASLNALEGESLRQFTKSFNELSGDQQDQVLTTASTGSPSDPNFAATTPTETTPGARALTPNLRDYFDYVKGWISTAYYSSEVGMKELGWTGENFFESFPGCQHAGGHS